MRIITKNSIVQRLTLIAKSPEHTNRMPHSTAIKKAEIDGQVIAIAPLETIDYSRILAEDPSEQSKLLSVASMPGFFYLDLRSEPSGKFLPSLRKVYAISEEHFPPSEAQEMFELPRDKVVSGSLSLPPTLSKHTTQLTSFSTVCHTINTTLLASLSSALNLSGSSRFESHHGNDHPSDTALNLIYSPAKTRLADAPDTTHTDTGTLTSLFCDKWGIQIEHPETKQWSFVEPREGCALVNVADSLQRLSGGRLHSCRHRHTQPVDGFEPRYFVVSYLRPQKVGS